MVSQLSFSASSAQLIAAKPLLQLVWEVVVEVVVEDVVQAAVLSRSYTLITACIVVKH